jgi:hypothetical protein
MADAPPAATDLPRSAMTHAGNVVELRAAGGIPTLVDERSNLVVLARQVLECRAVGVTVRSDHDDFPLTWAATDPEIATADVMQGSFVDPNNGRIAGGQVQVCDVRSEQCWPGWCQALDWLGIRAALVTLFSAGDGRSGVLSAYWSQPTVVDAEIALRARLLARQLEIGCASAGVIHQLRSAADRRRRLRLV